MKYGGGAGRWLLTDTETQRDRQGSTHCPRRGEVGFGLGVRGGAEGWRRESGGGVRDRRGRGRDRERERGRYGVVVADLAKVREEGRMRH